MKKLVRFKLSALALLGFTFMFTQCDFTAPRESREVQPQNEDYYVENNDPMGVDFTASDRTDPNFFDQVNISDPINFKNLQIFFIENAAPAACREEYITLQEAMDSNWVKIFETGEVNELEAKNYSDESIYINAGDIIKGGRQDRTLAYDVILHPKSRKQALTSFCVESGRWSQRGDEQADGFSETTKMISSREMKIASKKENNQSHVWEGVSNMQTKLSSNVSNYYSKDVVVNDAASSSSLELALDNKDLENLRLEYTAQFIEAIRDNHYGIAYAINGELYNIDMFSNHDLFYKLYEKLLNAAIIEAIAELDTESNNFTYLTKKDVKDLLKIDANADMSAKRLNGRTYWYEEDAEDLVIFTTVDDKCKDNWLHKNFVFKSENYVEWEEEYADYEMPHQQLNNVIDGTNLNW
ncbi:hypothetical protein K6119_00330 [Paracrocinitomix mangrovi]|uniref:ARPP-1 family domain-containing protein n=1 Tax=Paracrocinitomix mangrovi TaxID=2862509 RepID=UPI001C8E849E|nr:DUF6569 family protein [Paracrocinitomix mangrovi]UKN01960.1 hypothetical protein K6119_00330 [Paracrocinitomix mangrovi]